MVRDHLAAALLRCQPTVFHRPGVGFHTRYRSPDRWQWSSFPTPDTHATGPDPGPPNRSTESAAGPRKPNTRLRGDRERGRFFASVSPPESAAQLGTATGCAQRNQSQVCRPRYWESAHRACEIWSGPKATQTRRHSSLAPQIAVTVFANHHHSRIRKSAFESKDSSKIQFPAAEFPCASIPEDVAIH